MGPTPFLHPSPQAGGRGTQQGQISTQESLTPGPRDLFWEHESTLHWALVINGTGHQGELEHCGRMRPLLLVEDRHALPVLLRPNQRWQFERFTSSGKVAREAGAGQSSLGGEMTGGRHFPGPPSAQLAGHLQEPVQLLAAQP